LKGGALEAVSAKRFSEELFSDAQEDRNLIRIVWERALFAESLAKGTPNRDEVAVFSVLIHRVVPVIALLGVQFPEAVSRKFSRLNVFEGKGN